MFNTCDRFVERLDPFLAEWPRDVPVAVEIRNKTWVGDEWFACLRKHGAAFTLTDQAWMPSPLNIVRDCDPVTGSFAYVRLLGDRAEVDNRTKTLDQTVIDRSDQILANAEAISKLAMRVPVLTFVNNHYAGYAPETIRQLQQALAEHAPSL